MPLDRRIYISGDGYIPSENHRHRVTGHITVSAIVVVIVLHLSLVGHLHREVQA